VRKFDFESQLEDEERSVVERGDTVCQMAVFASITDGRKDDQTRTGPLVTTTVYIPVDR
jgi:hypothetical protein